MSQQNGVYWCQPRKRLRQPYHRLERKEGAPAHRWETVKPAEEKGRNKASSSVKIKWEHFGFRFGWGHKTRHFQEYWSGLPFPSPGNLPNPGIEHRSPTLQADTLPSELWIWDGDIILEYPGGLHVIMRVPKYREGWECFSVSQSVACEPSA